MVDSGTKIHWACGDRDFQHLSDPGGKGKVWREKVTQGGGIGRREQKGKKSDWECL